jgi:hypothetical protein
MCALLHQFSTVLYNLCTPVLLFVLTPYSFTILSTFFYGPHIDIPRWTISELDFITAIAELSSKPPPSKNPPLFIFKRCPLAALHNAKILEDHNYNLDSVIRKQHPSQISYGSEFKPSRELEMILEDHPLWDLLKEILDNGASFPLLPLNDNDHQIDLEFHSSRGNHKSSKRFHDIISKIITEDIEKGYALPLPLSILDKIPNASLAPLGCHKQTTIDAEGRIIPKYRMTHDQTFPGPSGLSVNLRVQKELLPPILYSFALCRIIHYIVDLC